MQEEKKKEGFPVSLQHAIAALIAALVVLAVFNVYQTYRASKALEERAAQEREAARPASLQLVIIKDFRCPDCHDIGIVADALRGMEGANVTREETVDFNSDRARRLVVEYDIKNIPTILVFGEINKSGVASVWGQIGIVKGDAVVITTVNPPYTNAKTGEIKGHVAVTFLTVPACAKCTDMRGMATGMAQAGVVFTNASAVEINSTEGAALVAKYGITRAPTLIFSPDVSVYPIMSGWNQVGTVESDGAYVLRAVFPPYYDTGSGRVAGLVNMTVLTDGSCGSCYNVTPLRSSVARAGVVFDDVSTVDISTPEGAALLGRYRITAVPTFVLSADIGEYEEYLQKLKMVGTVEPDGAYVFRNMTILGNGTTYRDLATNTTVTIGAGG